MQHDQCTNPFLALSMSFLYLRTCFPKIFSHEPSAFAQVVKKRVGRLFMPLKVAIVGGISVTMVGPSIQIEVYADHCVCGFWKASNVFHDPLLLSVSKTTYDSLFGCMAESIFTREAITKGKISYT